MNNKQEIFVFTNRTIIIYKITSEGKAAVVQTINSSIPELTKINRTNSCSFFDSNDNFYFFADNGLIRMLMDAVGNIDFKKIIDSADKGLANVIKLSEDKKEIFTFDSSNKLYAIYSLEDIRPKIEEFIDIIGDEDITCVFPFTTKNYRKMLILFTDCVKLYTFSYKFDEKKEIQLERTKNPKELEIGVVYDAWIGFNKKVAVLLHSDGTDYCVSSLEVETGTVINTIFLEM